MTRQIRYPMLFLMLAIFACTCPLLSQNRSSEIRRLQEEIRKGEQEIQRLQLERQIILQHLAAKRTFVAVFLLQGVVFGCFSAFVASQKNRRRLTWFTLGFFFSLIALITLVAVPKKDEAPPPKRIWVFVAVPGFALVLLLALWFAEWI